MKNYYDVLELSKGALTDSIKAAYRGKAKKLHPDVNDHPKAEQQFKHLREAYEVLSSQKKRQMYDRLGHREYVERFGGSIIEELSQSTAEQQATECEKTNRSTTSGTRSSQRATNTEQTRTQQTKTSNTTAESQTSPGSSAESANSSITESLATFVVAFLKQNSTWVIRGRTPISNGILASLVRLLIYGLLVQSVATAVALFVGGVGPVFASSAMFTGTLVVARVLYLVGFESLREDYIRIDGGTTPDAYTIPYAILAGIIGGCLTLFGFAMNHQAGWLLLSLVLGIVLLIYGWITTILGVGWGVADDYYNLGYDLNPLVWNFFVQLPVLFIIGSSGTSLELLSIIPVISISYLVGIVYLLRRYQLRGDIPLSRNRYLVRMRRILKQYI